MNLLTKGIIVSLTKILIAFKTLDFIYISTTMVKPSFGLSIFPFIYFTIISLPKKIKQNNFNFQQDH